MTRLANISVFLMLMTTALSFPSQPPDISAIVQEKVKQKQDLASSLLSSVTKTLTPDPERAVLDLNLPGKKTFDAITSAVVNFLRPQPIVDTIREEDKYGNDGEKFARVGKKVVGGVETVTNLLATAVDAPFNALKTLTRKASESLNNLGSKLVGL